MDKECPVQHGKSEYKSTLVKRSFDSSLLVGTYGQQAYVFDENIHDVEKTKTIVEVVDYSTVPGMELFSARCFDALVGMNIISPRDMGRLMAFASDSSNTNPNVQASLVEGDFKGFLSTLLDFGSHDVDFFVGDLTDHQFAKFTETEDIELGNDESATSLLDLFGYLSKLEDEQKSLEFLDKFVGFYNENRMTLLSRGVSAYNRDLGQQGALMSPRLLPLAEELLSLSREIFSENLTDGDPIDVQDFLHALDDEIAAARGFLVRFESKCPIEINKRVLSRKHDRIETVYGKQLGSKATHSRFAKMRGTDEKIKINRYGDCPFFQYGLEEIGSKE